MILKYALLLVALAPATSLAWGDGCKFTADRTGGVDAKGVEKVILRSGAGDLKVLGRSSAVRIEARGVACASKEDLLAQAQVSVRREGKPGATISTRTSISAWRCRRPSPWTPSTPAATRASRTWRR
jgi:hypothetical protein